MNGTWPASLVVKDETLRYLDKIKYEERLKSRGAALDLIVAGLLEAEKKQTARAK